MRSCRARARGQAVIELAIVMPLLLLIGLGSVDLGRVLSDSTVATGQVGAGLRSGARSSSADIGSVVRSAAAPEIANSAANWGAAAAGGSDDGCASGATCGDPQGCASGSTFWSAGSGSPPKACFAVGTCTAAGTPAQCTPVAWNSRPAGGSADILILRVVLHVTTWTPAVAQIAGGALTVVHDGYTAVTY